MSINHASRRRAALLLVLAGSAAAVPGFSAPRTSEPVPKALAGPASACASLAQEAIAWPDASTRIKSAELRAGGGTVSDGRGGNSPPLPEHCEITGVMHERTGSGGQHYAINFHVRLPTRWNHRFLFQGGGGTNGMLGTAIGPNGEGNAPALAQGYAVVSQDSGHDNATNSDPAKGGPVAFGFDAQARSDYGHASLKPTAEAAKAIIRAFYGAAPDYSYFYGCSKGGQEGMAFAQRYPEVFDGIVAAAPGFSLPKAAVAQTWDTQSFAAAAGLRPDTATPDLLARAFSVADLKLVSDSVLAACDADDGMADGIVGAFATCSSAKVLPRLRAAQCQAGKQDGCLTGAQIDGLTRALGGARSGKGEALYASFPWDAGIASPGWRAWKLGTPGQMPAMNIILGGGSLAAVFSTPPRAFTGGPDALLRYELGYDFDRDASMISRPVQVFPARLGMTSMHGPPICPPSERMVAR